ncbi:hypothetical protein E2C01_073170 [Portunus trituberculatus]|uniref:Uncharacterized protein n=1 Tax=Portunus trituberculatus TaxID=210409 RepID=A0A5B7I9W4_PORTR|nr:hypothetical protein [Portunus trituberculatus]
MQVRPCGPSRMKWSQIAASSSSRKAAHIPTNSSAITHRHDARRQERIRNRWRHFSELQGSVATVTRKTHQRPDCDWLPLDGGRKYSARD